MDGIHIFISSELLQHVAEYHPEGIKVTDLEKLKKTVVYKLEDDLGTAESGLSGLQELIDAAIEDAAENDEGCQFKDIDY